MTLVMAEGREAPSRNGDHRVARPSPADGAGGVARRAVVELTATVVRCRGPAELHQDHRRHEGHQEVHGRTGHGHQQPGVERLLAVGAGLVRRIDLLQVVIPGIFT